MNLFAKKFTVVLATAATLGVTSLSGCASMNNKERGATIGASTGAAIGAVIGRNNGGTARGAILGAVLGGAAGAVIGHQMDQQAKDIETAVPGATVERVGEGIAVTFPSGILFAVNSDQLQGAGRDNLTKLAQTMQRYPGSSVLIVGHTDNTGTDEYNMALSQRRAQAAAGYLVSQGIAAGSIRTEGRGESEPVAGNDTEAGKARNRRVEVAIFASEQYRQQILNQNHP
ncbi:MAG TPA: OmpA family protein [Longimicrobiaceae bacterium]|jgi:outer membrane protein OmpA-like peptidoglycan-associated protein|nr:OmpA family protein [Longimicrobiaceae bacterium]